MQRYFKRLVLKIKKYCNISQTLTLKDFKPTFIMYLSSYNSVYLNLNLKMYVFSSKGRRRINQESLRWSNVA
uniref:Uncharacterized protein n=1 Tax=Lepeophtheirus salmonis TaxID=72036 RepID=A0A0K2VIJ9_LEPSM